LKYLALIQLHLNGKQQPVRCIPRRNQLKSLYMLSLARPPPVYMQTILRKWTKTPSRHSCRLYRAVVLDDTEACLQNNWSSEPCSSGPLTHSTHTEQLHFTTQRALTLHCEQPRSVTLPTCSERISAKASIAFTIAH